MQAQVTIHTPPGSLCSLPLPGPCDPGTISLGEYMAWLRLLQCHTGLCHCRFTPHSIHLPPLGLSEQEPPISRSFKPLLSGWRTDVRGQPICRGGAKSKAEPQELCKQRREGKSSLWSLRSSGLNLDNQLDNISSMEYLTRQWIIPKLRWWHLGATVDLGFAICNWLVSDFYVYLLV